MKNKGFFLVIADHDKKMFNVIYIFDDTIYNEKVVKANESGRKIQCFNGGKHDSIESVILEYKVMKDDYKYSEELLV